MGLVEPHQFYPIDRRDALARGAHALQPVDVRLVAIDDLYARDAADVDEYAREHTASVVAVLRRLLDALPPDVAARLVASFEAAARARYAANAATGSRQPAGESVILHVVRRVGGAQ